MGATGYYSHSDCKLHNMGAGHPECPERIDAIEDRLLISGVADAFATFEHELIVSVDGREKLIYEGVVEERELPGEA